MADNSLGAKVGSPVVLPNHTIAALDTAITITGFGTVTNQTLYSYQDLDRMVVSGTFDAGTLTTGLKITLGSSRNVRTASTPTGANRVAVGRWVRMRSASSSISSQDNEGVIFYDGSDATSLYFAVAGASFTLTKSDTFLTSNERLFVEFDVSVDTYYTTAYLAYGAGLATSAKAGLVSGAIPMTNLVSTDLTSQTNCTIDAGDVAYCKYGMVNGLVTLHLSFNTITITGSAASISFTLPAAVPRPASATITGIGEVYDNSSSVGVLGDFAVNSAGTVTIAKGSGTWTGGTNTNYIRAQLSWFTT